MMPKSAQHADTVGAWSIAKAVTHEKGAYPFTKGACLESHFSCYPSGERGAAHDDTGRHRLPAHWAAAIFGEVPLSGIVRLCEENP